MSNITVSSWKLIVVMSKTVKTVILILGYRYRISVIADDKTDEVHIILGDREVRTLIMKRA